jgi:hypothetical protein
MSSNQTSILEQIKAMSCEDRHKLLNLLNEKESILVKPYNYEFFQDCHLNSNPYNLKSYQKPVCLHKELIAPRYYCIICKEIEKQQKIEDATAFENAREPVFVEPLNLSGYKCVKENPYNLKLNQKPVCPHKTLLAPYYYCTFCSYKQFIDKEKDKADTELFNNVAIEKFFSSL